ncbi:GreA/GreB family elongation factor [Limnobacter alexandrii]|uniref:GreA/GreB family elongation factor n=1 Tax=Limnobacter alexandrii TaxID=2570352 RepID=UPI001109D6D4|nr:GreA/GreB family elongation factor [Limnobacter alexandrii]
MTKLRTSERWINELDLARISKLNTSLPPELLEAIDDAEVTTPQEMPSDVITMNSLFTIVETESGHSKKLMLCYPSDAEPAKGCVSVLSPVGASLLGRKAGTLAQWASPNGEQHFAMVKEILFQPEASGDYIT